MPNGKGLTFLIPIFQTPHLCSIIFPYNYPYVGVSTSTVHQNIEVFQCPQQNLLLASRIDSVIRFNSNYQTAFYRLKIIFTAHYTIIFFIASRYLLNLKHVTVFKKFTDIFLAIEIVIRISNNTNTNRNRKSV